MCIQFRKQNSILQILVSTMSGIVVAFFLDATKFSYRDHGALNVGTFIELYNYKLLNFHSSL